MIIRCPYCHARLGVPPTEPPARLFHHPDGSHTVIPWDPPPELDRRDEGVHA